MGAASGISKQRCMEICMERKQRDARVNGATFSTGGRCLCEINGSQISPDARYETCYLPDEGKHVFTIHVALIVFTATPQYNTRSWYWTYATFGCFKNFSSYFYAY